jgi:hypothetical protein
LIQAVNYGDSDVQVYAANSMVVGDRGLVVRSYTARINGQNVSTPSVSMLCERLELSPPRGVTSLDAGDFVEIKLEVLVLPRKQVR